MLFLYKNITVINFFPLYFYVLLHNKYLCFSDSVTYDLLLSPVSIVAGILYGLIWGFIVKYVPERSDVSIIITNILLKLHKIIVLLISLSLKLLEVWRKINLK